MICSIYRHLCRYVFHNPSYKGKPVSKEQWKGVWTVTGGTGKFEGSSGGGTWTSYRLTPEQSYSEVEGEVETP